MPLAEWTEKQTEENSRLDIGASAVLFVTPLCGTCKAAEKMLEIAEAAGIRYTAAKTNINFAPRLAREWQIESVPCLVVIRNGKLLRKEYAIHSASHLFEMLRN